jgi:serine/threonine-protein kinase PknK
MEDVEADRRDSTRPQNTFSAGADSALFREGLARLLADAGHDVVGRAADATTLVSAVETLEPDLAMIDIRMAPERTDDGALAARRLRERDPRLGIVLLSAPRDPPRSDYVPR